MPQSAKMTKLLIFLSHASEDKPRVRKLCKRLRDDGFDPWLDEERLLPGQDWEQEIQQAMRRSQAILLCFSRLSVAKEGYVQREYRKAQEYQAEKPEGTIYLIPLRLDDCEVPFSLRELQYVDYPSGYAQLVKALNLRAEKVNAAPAQPKTERQTSPAPRVQKSEAPSGGPAFNIKGGIYAGRDVVMGNQTNYITVNQSTTNIHTPAELVAALQQLQAEVAALKTAPSLDEGDAKTVEAIADRVRGALAEAQKPQPDGGRIVSTLEKARKTMDALGGSLGSALTLGATLGNLAAAASKLFGG